MLSLIIILHIQADLPIFRYNNLKAIQMQKNPGHQPERFQVYKEIKNGLGFRLPNNSHIFYYDSHGGWKDQYGNYYNADGKADEEPDSNSQKSISQGDWSSEDQYQKEFGPSPDIQQDFQKQADQSEIQLAIAKNLSQLQNHIQKDPLRVNFQILDLQKEEPLPTVKELLLQYRKKVKGIISVFYDTPQTPDSQQPNAGYFVVKNVAEATKLIHLQGENIVGSDISFDVQTFEQLKNDPLSEQQLENGVPSFVDVSQNEKLFTIQLENGQGFTCDKKTYDKWLNSLQLSVHQLVKMKKNEKKQKIPIVKLNKEQIGKITASQFEGKKVIVKEYVPVKRHQHQEETQAVQQKKVEEKESKQGEKPQQEESKQEYKVEKEEQEKKPEQKQAPKQ